MGAVAGRAGAWTIRDKVAWLAGICAAAAVVATLVAVRQGRTGERALQPLLQFDLDLAMDQGPRHRVPALSPDGTRMVYESHGQLYLRRLDQLVATALPGTAGAAGPFYSPDGRWIGFRMDGRLRKISADGGAPLDQCDVRTIDAIGADWKEEGIVIASSTGGLVRISPDHCESTPLTTLDQAAVEVSHRWLQILPDGKGVLYSSNTAMNSRWDQATIKIDFATLRDHLLPARSRFA